MTGYYCSQTMLELLDLPSPVLYSAVAQTISRLVDANSVNDRGPITRFHARLQPNITVESYLQR